MTICFYCGVDWTKGQGDDGHCENTRCIEMQAIDQSIVEAMNIIGLVIDEELDQYKLNEAWNILNRLVGKWKE